MKSVMHTKSMIENEDSPYIVQYGLRYLRQNPFPYFSVTVTAPDSMDVAVGCCHEDILKVYPDMQDIIDLHCSNPYGEPAYPNADGWYWYSSFDGKGTHTDKDDIEMFAKHVRISIEDARSMRIKKTRNKNGSIPKQFTKFIANQRERWLIEANAVIEKYDLHGWDA